MNQHLMLLNNQQRMVSTSYATSNLLVIKSTMVLNY